MSNEFFNSKFTIHNSQLAPYAPQGVEVVVHDGRPAAIWLKRRRRRVVSIVNMWRIDEEWWRKPISRLYFLIELENSARITVFQDLVSGQWYRQNWA